MKRPPLILPLLILFVAPLVEAETLPEFYQSEYSSVFSDRLRINGEAGAAWFDTGEEGEYPDNEFLVEEAKLFIEASIVDDIYAFAEIDVMRREEPDEKLQLGELYLDFEDVSKLWNQDRVLNVRVGRFDIPFGEEYLTRDAIDNPLITHSLSDIWGVDEGIQFYGSLKKFEYTFAIQNGGSPVASDYHPDKSLVGRILYRTAPRFHFSFSAMRTGKLDVRDDRFSEVWFGNGFFRLLGSIVTSSTLEGNLFQGDGHRQWERGHVHLAAGKLQYDDNDAEADNSRDLHYFQIEAVQHLNRSKEYPWYAAARFSRITADRGFPLVGNGSLETYLFDNDELAEELWRLSLGIGYRIGKNVLLKAEYNFENGKSLTGENRDEENFFGMEAAVRF
ncbi:hypothetical protein L0222_11210 [bacterium]|nr:hypothetical protein [bacterium]MCI0603803.1 hypothetical protein [bacterium]